MTVQVEIAGHELEVVEPSELSLVATRIVALCQAKTPVEQRICLAWAAAHSTDMKVCWSAAEAVAEARADEQIVPVRIAWVPRNEERKRRRDLLGELLGGWALDRLQERALSRNSDSCRILVGEPALLSELEARWGERSGGKDDAAAFAAFVERQAGITLDRAERRLRGDRYRAPRAVVEEVMTSPGFMEALEVLSAKLDRGLDGVVVDVRAYLEEMASEQHRLAVDLWARYAKFMYARGYRLDVDQVGLEKVRRLGADHPLVFLPSHRSNLDPYVMSSLLYENGLPQNHTLGGINMAFWPIGPLGRRVGVVFIRRSFRDNEVYQFVLQRYLGFLVSKRFNMEWYVEGTRSRTGKLMPPKLGLVNWLIDAVDSMERDDVYAVPTSIVYDLLPEAAEMTQESRGSVKTGEGLWWLVKYARLQRGKFGSVHVTFGEPLNVRQTLQSFTSPDTAPTSAEGRLARSKIAFEVCVRINKAALITAPALLLFALMGVEDRALTFTEVREVVQPVLAYAESRNIPLNIDAAELATADGLASTLEFLVDHGLIECFAEGDEPVYRIGPDQELLGAFYRNSIIHWFVSRAIVELILISADRFPADDRFEAGWQEALRLRDLLKFEFFFPEKAEFSKDMYAEMVHLDPRWRHREVSGLDEVTRELVNSGMLVAHRTLRSFVEAYAVVAHHLVSLGDAAADPKHVVPSCLKLGQQYRLQRKVTSSEAVSAHLFGTALKLAGNRGLLAANMSTGRKAFADELDDVLSRLEVIHDLDHARSLETT